MNFRTFSAKTPKHLLLFFSIFVVAGFLLVSANLANGIVTGVPGCGANDCGQSPYEPQNEWNPDCGGCPGDQICSGDEWPNPVPGKTFRGQCVPATYTCTNNQCVKQIATGGGQTLAQCQANCGAHYQCVNGQCVPSSTGPTAAQCQASCGSGGPCGVYHWNPWPSDCQPGTTVPGTQTRYGEDDCGNQIPQTRNCGCVAPKVDKGGICCNSNQTNYNNQCCTPDCGPTKQCGDSNGCGGTCAATTATPLSGMVDIVMNEIYQDITKNLKFYKPEMEDLNPYDTIDCVLKGYPQTSGEIKGKLILDTGSVTQVLKEGTLSWDGTEYVWTIQGGPNDWGKDLFALPLVDNVLPADRKIKCEVTKKCGSADEKLESKRKLVSLCVHVWGGGDNQSANPRIAGAEIFKFAEVDGLGSFWLKPSEFMDTSIRAISLATADPLKKYQPQFEYYASLKKINDSSSLQWWWTSGHFERKEIEKVSECKDIDLFYVRTSKQPNSSGRFSGYQDVIYLSADYNPYVPLHETAHFLGLADEYPGVDSFLTKRGKNCDPNQSCANFVNIFSGYTYSQANCIKECGSDTFNRSSLNSVMRYPERGSKVGGKDTSRFNRVGCAIIVKSIVPSKSYDVAYQECDPATMKLHPSDSCDSDIDCNTADGFGNYVLSLDCGRCNQTTSKCEFKSLTGAPCTVYTSGTHTVAGVCAYSGVAPYRCVNQHP